MPQLTEISIQNLRGLQDLTLQDTRTFNLIVGPSEIGKTTVLEGIFISSSLAFMPGLVHVNRFRGASTANEEQMRSVLLSLFRNYEESAIDVQLKLKNSVGKYGCSTSFTKYYGDDVSMEVNNGDVYKNYQGQTLLGVKGAIRLTGAASGEMQKSLIFTQNAMNVSEEIPHAIKIQNDDIDRNQHNKYFPVSMMLAKHELSNAVTHAVAHKKKEAILEELRKINPSISGFEFSRDNNVVIDIGLDTMVGIHITGGGTREVLSTLGNLCNPDMDVFLIDEIGKNIYYASLKEYLRAVLSFCKQQGKQIFATTHSKDMLLALNELLQEDSTFQEDVMCYSMARNKHGKVKAYSYDHQTIERCIANGIEIR